MRGPVGSVAVAPIFAVTALVLGTTACVQEPPGLDECANLREVHASGSVQGEFGFLADFDFAIQAGGSYSVIPPDGSACARDIAIQLEAVCRICDHAPHTCQETVESVLDTPTPACRACGDGACTYGENPSRCPQDCAAPCGDGVCDGTESFQSCPVDCGDVACGDRLCEPGENPVNCAEDCGTACGDGTCDNDESDTNCPADCTEPCGDGLCNPGETTLTCATDCALTACGDADCEPGEGPIVCPQDCGGCVPNAATCLGNTLAVCNVDGQSTAFRTCGQGNACRDGSCRAADPIQGQTDVEALMLGLWRVTLRLYADNAVERRVDVGNAVYQLEVFEITPPVSEFGVWGWKGALKASSFCLLEEPGFQAGEGTCRPFEPAQLGTCGTVDCVQVLEVPAAGTFNAVTDELVMSSSTRTRGNIFHLEGGGYLFLDIDVSGAGTVINGLVGDADCASWCSYTLNRAGTFEGAFPGYSSDDWTVSFAKLIAE